MTDYNIAAAAAIESQAMEISKVLPDLDPHRLVISAATILVARYMARTDALNSDLASMQAEALIRDQALADVEVRIAKMQATVDVALKTIRAGGADAVLEQQARLDQAEALLREWEAGCITTDQRIDLRRRTRDALGLAQVPYVEPF